MAKATSKPIRFRSTAAQAFDKNNLSYNFEKQTVSIWTVNGRLRTVSFECSSDQLERLKSCQKGETDLSLIEGTFYLIAGIEIAEQPLAAVTDYLAFDSGIINIATTSDGDNWSGGAVTLRRKKNRALRAKLQSKGTKSAKRLLKKRSKKSHGLSLTRIMLLVRKLLSWLNTPIAGSLMRISKASGIGHGLESHSEQN